MRIKRINLTEFDPETMEFPTDYITIEQFLQDPEVKIYYNAMFMLRRTKHLKTSKYGYMLED